MTFALYVAVVCKKVLAAGVRRDEAESFVTVEPFHDTKFSFQDKSYVAGKNNPVLSIGVKTLPC